MNMLHSGSCALLVLVGSTKVMTAWVGDSRAVLGCCYGPDPGLWRAKPLSKDHKPEDPKECKRITSHNGRVGDQRICDPWLFAARNRIIVGGITPEALQERTGA